MAKNTSPLETVRRLLDRAEHPNTPEAERELCFMQANKLMTKHAIDEVLLNSARTKAEREAPMSKTISLGESAQDEFWPILQTILGGIADLNRCRVVTAWYKREATIVGFTEDVEWTEMLFTSVYFTFLSSINPKWDPAKDWDENVYNFKVAGYKWIDINAMSVQNGGPDCRKLEERYNWAEGRFMPMPTTKLTGKLISAYKRHAKKIGDTNLVSTQSHEAYRSQYSEAFKNQMMTRLWRMEEESKEEYKSSGAELAIIDRREDVDALFYDLFPQFSPAEQERRAQKMREMAEAEKRRLQEELDAMTPEQREEYYRKKERDEARAAKRDRRYWAQQSRQYDSSAHARGRKAADSVQLTRTTKVSDTKRSGAIEG